MLNSKLYINIFLYNTLYSSYQRKSLSKISLLLNNKTIKNIFCSDEDISNGDISNREKEIKSLLISLKKIKANIKKIKRLQDKYKIESKIIIFINSHYIHRYHIKMLYDTWEYLNFRGVPFKDYWIQIYHLFNELNSININIRFQ